ncbi:MAG: helix-turn-helix transcriptional regulator [Bacteroidales bacterium]|nr:helix-turn-helix transcriptional regulator [Candidatus Latescibacterota bacterium]
MSIYSMNDKGILKEIARRIRRRRLNMNMPQKELADKAGLSRTAISNIEQGNSFGVLTLIQVLRALEALEDLDAFLPDPGISPMQLARMKGRQRKRARAGRAQSRAKTDRSVTGSDGKSGVSDLNDSPNSDDSTSDKGGI